MPFRMDIESIAVLISKAAELEYKNGGRGSHD